MTPRKASSVASEHAAVAAIRSSGAQRVKVAVSDVDGVLRGKYLHRDKFLGVAEPPPKGGFGFCDVVLGWDMMDACYDNTTITGWQHGFPDAHARLDMNTARHVPWDDGVPWDSVLRQSVCALFLLCCAGIPGIAQQGRWV